MSRTFILHTKWSLTHTAQTHMSVIYIYINILAFVLVPLFLHGLLRSIGQRLFCHLHLEYGRASSFGCSKRGYERRIPHSCSKHSTKLNGIGWAPSASSRQQQYRTRIICVNTVGPTSCRHPPPVPRKWWK